MESTLINMIPVIMIFSIPLSAIIGSFYLKALKIKSEQQSMQLNAKEERIIKAMMLENEELRQRISNLEEIVTSQTFDSQKSLEKDL